MVSRSLSVLLAGWMIGASGAPYAQAKAQAKNDPRGAHISRGKAAIEHLGTGESARLKVELYDDTKLAGSIVEIGDDQFVLHDAKTGKNTEIAYSAVKRLKGNAPGMARTIALGAGALPSKTALIVLAALAVAVIALVASDKSLVGLLSPKPAPQANRSFYIRRSAKLPCANPFAGKSRAAAQEFPCKPSTYGWNNPRVSLAVHLLFISGKDGRQKFRPDFGPVVIKS